MQISSEGVTDLATGGYLGSNDLDRSLYDLFSCMECEEVFLYNE